MGASNHASLNPALPAAVFALSEMAPENQRPRIAGPLPAPIHWYSDYLLAAGGLAAGLGAVGAAVSAGWGGGAGTPDFTL